MSGDAATAPDEHSARDVARTAPSRNAARASEDMSSAAGESMDVPPLLDTANHPDVDLHDQRLRNVVVALRTSTALRNAAILPADHRAPKVSRTLLREAASRPLRP